MSKAEEKKEPIQEPKKAPPPEKKKKAAKKKKKKRYNLVSGVGINLIPPKTDEEIKVDSTKGKVNISAAIAILIIIIVSIAVVGFNIFSKLNLNNQKEVLAVLDQKLEGRASLIDSNNEMLARIDLYEEIKESTYSNKDVLDYWNAVIADYGSYDSVELTNSLGFTVKGSADSLTDASMLWYLLGNDKRIETVNLKSVSKDGNIVRFNFEGKLNFDEFRSN